MDSPKLSLKVGFFVAVALSVIAFLLLSFSKGPGMLTRTYDIVVKSANVGGLKVGASVMVSGVNVGRVREITLAADGRAVLIRCQILGEHQVHADAHFEIEQSGFLGDQHVAILPGANAGEVLRDGAVVEAQEPFNLQEAARSAVGLMQKLDTAAGRIDAAVERVDTVLLGPDNLLSISNTVVQLNEVSRRAGEAVADVQQLIRSNSPAVAGTLSNLNAFSATLTTVATNLDAVIDGNRAGLEATLASLRQAAGDVRSLTGDLQQGRGVAGALLKDEALRDQVASMVGNLTVLSSNLSQHGILWKPDRTRSLENDTGYTGRNPFR